LKPTLPKGTRDFLPQDIKKREYIFSIIRHYFSIYGYDAIETPAMESLDTLSGNYGEEGDRLLFKILNNGDYLKDVDKETLHARDSAALVRQISKRGLRYDLTVPFARYIVMNRQHIKFPFKRSAIQPVWRADKPQKGRYQEFYQCDADVAGSPSLFYEAELVRLYDRVFAALKLPVEIRWNNRKVLYGIAETAGLAADFQTVTIIIDKLDKIGMEGVEKDLLSKEFDSSNIRTLLDLIVEKDPEALAAKMRSETGLKGIEELRTVIGYLKPAPLENGFVFDATLARGLSYYTGCIFEVTAPGVRMGSIGGGGRYDNLTAVFGLRDVSGVGISFGVERIYDVMEELKLFPESLARSKNLLIACMDPASFEYAIGVTGRLRDKNISCDLYPEVARLQKQISYANDAGYAYVALIGEDERARDMLTLKNMASGDQALVDLPELVKMVSQ